MNTESLFFSNPRMSNTPMLCCIPLNE
uniref:Uncharacterized protein n=1 Tax=Rhizophora mucronata TaxID=61149 RepID=A0A2P2QGT2_RHIMU